MSLTQDEREWLHRIEDKLDQIAMNGCAKAEQHRDHEVRLRSVERENAEGRGKAAVIGMAAGAVASVVFGWLGKHI